ncbi:MAG: hypothetical protein K2H86_02800 [Muribaculaceae bacterium]|nr:hypothetical protein [Muribaculaceae bacterium]
MDATVNYPIRYGDRIFVRVMMMGNTICEFTLENVASFTEVTGEIRYALSDRHGLGKAIVRNYSRGWSVETPIMLYGRNPGPRRQQRTATSRYATGTIRTNTSSRPAMLMPYETH